MEDLDVLIFDVDGTLVDSRKDIVRAINHVRKTLGLKPKPAAEIISYVGTGVEDLVRSSLGKKNLQHFDRSMKLMIDYYVKHSADYSKLYPNVKNVLTYFKKKKLFVMSNRKSIFAKATLRELGIAKYFKKILGADKEHCKKPSTCIFDSDPYLSKIDKKKAIIIGDMSYDIETGIAYGIKTCWVSYGLGKLKDIRHLKPDYMIDDIGRLKKIIKK